MARCSEIIGGSSEGWRHDIAGMTPAIRSGMRTELSPSRVDPNDTYFTVAEVAQRLKVNDDTVRRMFLEEPGVIVLYRPRKGRRAYRTLRIPERVYERVLNRFVKVA
jgi:excisionase family DNA binding protein